MSPSVANVLQSAFNPKLTNRGVVRPIGLFIGEAGCEPTVLDAHDGDGYPENATRPRSP